MSVTLIAPSQTRFERDANRILDVLHQTTDFSRLRDLVVLDLACGSEVGRFHEGRRGMPPEFARFLARRGAQVYGIDCSPGELGEPYQHIQADLVPLVLKNQLAQMPELKDTLFDVVRCRGFVEEPCDPTLARILRNKKVKLPDFRKQLTDQSMELVGERGLVFIENDVFRKSGRRLEKI